MADFDKLIEGFEETVEKPVKSAKTGKKLTTNVAVNEIVNAIMNIVCQTNADAIVEATIPLVKKRIEEEIGVIPKRVEVKTEFQSKTVEGATHDKFEELLRMVGADIPVYLTGKAGTGKNVICQQVATALGLDFYFTNAVTQEYKLTGFIDANGTYHPTQFFKAFTQGGLFFLDEMDASVPETLIILNAAIANRYFDFPTGRTRANPKFRVIAAGNTLGTGADINYTGRYSLDRASLDRFALVQIDYSRKIEDAITENNNDLVNFAHRFREAADAAGVECLCTYRAITMIVKMEKVFDSLSEVMEAALVKGMDRDSLHILQKRISDMSDMNANKYAKVFMSMV
jgi:hypothetical protein